MHGMWSETQRGFAISGELPIHEYLGSETPHTGKGRFLTLALRGCRCPQNWSGAEHMHQALCTCTAVQLVLVAFSNKLSVKPNSIHITLLISFTWCSRSEIGDSCHHETAVEQNLPGRSYTGYCSPVGNPLLHKTHATGSHGSHRET